MRTPLLQDGELPAQDQVLRAFPVSLRWDSRSHAATRVIRRKTNRRHMIGDHHGQTPGEQLSWSAMVEILGTHNSSQKAHLRARRVSGAFVIAHRDRVLHQGMIYQIPSTGSILYGHTLTALPDHRRRGSSSRSSSRSRGQWSAGTPAWWRSSSGTRSWRYGAPPPRPKRMRSGRSARRWIWSRRRASWGRRLCTGAGGAGGGGDGRGGGNPGRGW
jgi:hypothetical protein